MSLSSFYAARSGKQPERRPSHPTRGGGAPGAPTPITTPEAPPIGAAAEVLDLKEVMDAAAAVDALVERAGARLGVLRRLLAEAQSIERALEDKTARLRDCLERTCDVSDRLEDRIRRADSLAQRLDGVTTADLAQAAADLDRQTAQVQARIGIMIDGAEERLRQLQREAAIVDPGGRRIDRAELAADHLLGVVRKAREADAALARRIAEARREPIPLEQGEIVPPAEPASSL